MLKVILSMCGSRWVLNGVPELPLITAVALVGTVIQEVARVAIVEGEVPVAVTAVVVAEGCCSGYIHILHYGQVS